MFMVVGSGETLRCIWDDRRSEFDVQSSAERFSVLRAQLGQRSGRIVHSQQGQVYYVPVGGGALGLPLKLLHLCREHLRQGHHGPHPREGIRLREVNE